MDVSHVAFGHRRQPIASWPSLIIISVAAVVAAVFFVSVALPYLTLNPAMLARYAARRFAILIHIAAGGVALLTGPLQLWLGVSGRTTAVHRRLGYTYVASVAVGSSAAFYLAPRTSLGWGFGAGITGLAVAWVVTTTLAVAAIRRGVIEQHREWMIRSYVVTFAFVTFRAFWSVLDAAGIGTRQEQLAASSWFCWAVPLLITEAVLQGRKIRLQSAAWPAGRTFEPPPRPTSRSAAGSPSQR
jgi:uncharacterized membrane protein